MRILEEEIDLREETRALEKARAALEPDTYVVRAREQSETQHGLHGRTRDVITDINALPNSGSFGKELALLDAASRAMYDATSILAEPNTGPQAIAAETEAIELLLQSKRCNPKGGGGGGGSSPGGGGSGTTEAVALSLYGPGSDLNARIEERSVRQMTGVAGETLPEEYRTGLEAFFNAVESSN